MLCLKKIPQNFIQSRKSRGTDLLDGSGQRRKQDRDVDLRQDGTKDDRLLLVRIEKRLLQGQESRRLLQIFHQTEQENVLASIQLHADQTADLQQSAQTLCKY